MMLEQFTARNPEWGLTELAERLGVSKSMAHRLLSTLMDRGFVAQNPRTRRYRLGLRLLGLGAVVGDNLRIRQVALPHMEALARATGESVFLTVLEDQCAMPVARVELRHTVDWLFGVGERSPLTAGASNKVLLAFLPPEQQEALIAAAAAEAGSSAARDPEELRAELARIRAQGWAFSVGEVTPHSAAVAVPIFTRDGEIVASLAVAGPASRFTAEVIPGLIDRALEAALAIARHYRDGHGPVG